MQFTANAISSASGGASISSIGNLARRPEASASHLAPAPFADLFSDAVAQMNQLEEGARTAVDRMMTGTGVDIHQAMIATQKASMAFELALSVRNKAVQAYQSVIGMQF
jgi:flagellar hook-basal body complex protein FliE